MMASVNVKWVGFLQNRIKTVELDKNIWQLLYVLASEFYFIYLFIYFFFQNGIEKMWDLIKIHNR